MAAGEYTSPFVDDAAVPGNEIILRRVPPGFIDWDSPDINGLPRITSGGFQDYSAEKALTEFGLPGACMSVIVLTLVHQAGTSAEAILSAFGPTNGLARLTAGAIRACRQGIQLDPRLGEPWHAVVFAKDNAQRNKTMRSCLSQAASWFIAPSVRPGSG